MYSIDNISGRHRPIPNEQWEDNQTSHQFWLADTVLNWLLIDGSYRPSWISQSIQSCYSWHYQICHHFGWLIRLSTDYELKGCKDHLEPIIASVSCYPDTMLFSSYQSMVRTDHFKILKIEDQHSLQLITNLWVLSTTINSWQDSNNHSIDSRYFMTWFFIMIMNLSFIQAL